MLYAGITQAGGYETFSSESTDFCLKMEWIRRFCDWLEIRLTGSKYPSQGGAFVLNIWIAYRSNFHVADQVSLGVAN